MILHLSPTCVHGVHRLSEIFASGFLCVAMIRFILYNHCNGAVLLLCGGRTPHNASEALTPLHRRYLFSGYIIIYSRGYINGIIARKSPRLYGYFV